MKFILKLKNFKTIEILGYALAFFNPFPLGIVVGVFMYGFESKKYVESGKRIIAFSIIWLIFVLIWNYTIGIKIKVS